MKLLLASTAVYLGNYTGANKINRLLIEEFAQRGHECRVIAVSTPLMNADQPSAQEEPGIERIGITSESQILRVADVEVHVVDVPNLGELPRLRGYLQRQITTFDPDIIIVSSEDWGQFVLEAATSSAADRVVYLAHTGLALPCGPDSLMPNPAGTRSLTKAAAVIGLSRFLSDYISTWSGAKTQTIYSAGYGNGPFPHYGWFEQGYVMMINPCAVKGISIFLDMACARPELQFAAVPTWGTTDADREALAAVPNITILPRTTDIDSLYAQARVLIVPSLWRETFGLVVVEAMLRGIPVLAADTGGLPEAKCGTDYVIPVNPIANYVFDESLTLAQEIPAQDSAPWLAALDELLSDSDLYARQSAAARTAAHKFVEQLSFDQYDAVFQQVIAKRAEHKATQPTSEQRVQGFSDKKRALLELLKQEKQRDHTDQLTIPVVPRDGRALPLSFAQQRVWFLEQYTPNTALYNIPTALRLQGELDTAALAQALNSLVERHEALRTSFPLRDGQPVQLIHPSSTVPLPLTSLADLPPAARDAEAQRLLLQHANTPFDIAHGPLLRAALLQLAPDHHILLLAFHHLVADGWSFDILLREVAACYSAARHHQQANLPSLALQYADLAAWQRDWLSGSRLEQQLAFWRNELAGAPALLELPTDHPRPPIQSFQGASEEWLLPSALVAGLARLSQQHGLTLFMTLLGAYAIVLQRYSGQHDLVIGTPIANRTRREQEALIGFFANTLALRLKVAGESTLAEVLAGVKDVALGAYAHQDVPFELLVDTLQPERSLSYAPIFQTAFSFQNVSNADYELDDLKVSTISIKSEVAKFDLTMAIYHQQDKMVVSLEYNTALFDGATATRLLKHYQAVLAAIVADINQPVATLPLLSPAERHQLLVDFTATARPYPHDQPLAALFQAQVERTPHAPAVRCGTSSLSYAELNSQANQLAHWLRLRGVDPDVLVGVALERSPLLLVALVAIIKAGGAYLPLDPHAPAARLRLMLDDTQAPLVLTDSALAQLLPAEQAELVCLDQLALDDQPTDNPPIINSATDLAYVIYTSGSTGTPKGAMIPQRAISRLLFNIAYVQLDSQQTILQLAPVSFDASTFEIWGALLHGGCCAVATERVMTPAEIGSAIRQHNVTTMWLTSSLFNTVIDEAPGALQPLQQLLIGGEALSVRHVALAQHLLPNTQIINGYGPTESTTFACCYPIPRPFNPDAASIPIGPPIANTTVHILDRHMQPSPIGVPGELYIGGAGLARGYLNRPELTNEKFIADPFCHDLTARLYRTGDLVRFLPNGAIEYIGRLDNQVKVRGFRIELGEIETVLRQHPLLQEAAVIVREDVPNEKRLVAYIVPLEGTIAVDALRQSLRERLPDYMVPELFVSLRTLPLTPNGKLDRAALPAPDTTRPMLEHAFVAPRTPTEAQLASLWSELLGVDQIGVSDNFFALGGNSLRATQLMTRVRECFDADIPLREFFETPTIEGLALVIVEAQVGDDAELLELLNVIEQQETLAPNT